MLTDIIAASNASINQTTCSSSSSSLALLLKKRDEIYYEDCIIDHLVSKGYSRVCDCRSGCPHGNHHGTTSKYHHFDHNWLSFKYSGDELEELSVPTWSRMSGIDLTPDIVAVKDGKSAIIEVKKFYVKPTPKMPFSSHDYNFLYDYSLPPVLPVSVDYTLTTTPTPAGSWEDTKNKIKYEWHGGPTIRVLSYAVPDEKPTFWQEGQLWNDINRLKYSQVKYSAEFGIPPQLYFIGVVHDPHGLSMARLQYNIEFLCADFQLQAKPRNYVFQQKFPNNNLQRIETIPFDYELHSLTINSSRSAAVFVVQIF